MFQTNKPKGKKIKMIQATKGPIRMSRQPNYIHRGQIHDKKNKKRKTLK